jgi:hypothetical protein
MVLILNRIPLLLIRRILFGGELLPIRWILLRLIGIISCWWVVRILIWVIGTGLMV